MTKIGLVSLGCSKNLIDSETMLGYLMQSDYELTTQPEDAEVLIVNTCGFIESAKKESIDAILEMAEYKETGNCQTLVVTGCLSQRYKNQLREELPEVDILLGVDEYAQLPALLNERHAPGLVLGPLQTFRVLATPSHYAYLRIAEGCDNHCSFCAIPLIRGKYRSRPAGEIMTEAEELAARGVKEIVVIAQDTTRYGTDMHGERGLPQLLRTLCKTDLQWIRLLYAYPNDITDELLKVMTGEEKILNYLDIPLQHVDDVLLKRMNRRSNIADLDELYRKIRNMDPDFVLRTTLISGFPGETEAQHRTLMTFMEEHPFDRAGVFCYSAEEGTPAARLPDQVAEEQARAWADELMVQQEEISRRRLERRLGRVYTVLVDGYDESTGQYIGRSYGEAPEIDGLVYFRSERSHELGDFVQVRMDKGTVHDLFGETV